MSIKKSFIILVLILSGCAKKETNNIALANNYIKEASYEAESGNYQKALYLADQAYKHNKTPQVNALRATLLYQLKNFNESSALFKKIMEDRETPSNLRADVKNNYAVSLLCLNKKDEAKKLWIELTSDRNYFSPEVAWYNLGLLEFNEALSKKAEKEESKKLQSNIHFNRAEKLFEKAIDIASNYIDSYFYLALCQEQLDELEKAKENLLIILTKIDNHGPAKQLLERIDKQIHNKRRIN